MAAPELTSRPFYVRAWGDYGLFTQPGTQAEPSTYPVMTPTAAQGLLEAIFFKPEMRYIIERIGVLKPIRMTSMKINGVADKPTRLDQTYYSRPAQRLLTVLCDVDYLIQFRIGLNEERISPDQNALTKYTAQVLRRLESGRVFRDPCLGKRIFPARFALVERPEELRLANINRRVGKMTHTRVWSDERIPGTKASVGPERYIYFDAHIINGSMDVPRVYDART